MPINANYEYLEAEKKFLSSHTVEEKIKCLEEMIRTAPSHKGAENLRAQLRQRLAKLKKEFEKEKSKKKGKSIGIKREGDSQVTIFGMTKSGKSSLLASLTSAKPKISDIPYTTLTPEIGALHLDGIIVQMIELPSRFDKETLSVIKTSDLVLILITNLNELLEIAKAFKDANVQTKKIIVLNKIDSIQESELNKLKSINLVKISTKTKEGIEELKQKILENINLIRVYTKEPGKKVSEKPIVLKINSTIRDLAKKIREDFPERFIKAVIWGKSAKFSGQTVGMEHRLQDKDIVELYLKI